MTRIMRFMMRRTGWICPTGDMVDDTTFSDGASHQTLLIADKTTNIIYAVNAPFGFNNAFSGAMPFGATERFRRSHISSV